MGCDTDAFCHNYKCSSPTDFDDFLDPEGGSPNATLVVVLLLALGISTLKIPKAFLTCSGVQRNFVYTFVLTFPTYLPSQILKLIFN